MYYSARYDAGECIPLLAKMRDTCTRSCLVGPPSATGPSVHDTLVAWGRLVSARFHADNLRVSTRSGTSTVPLTDGSVAPVVAVITDLGRSVRQTEASVLNACTTLGGRLDGVQASSAALQSRIAVLETLLSNARISPPSAGSPVATASASATTTPHYSPSRSGARSGIGSVVRTPQIQPSEGPAGIESSSSSCDRDATASSAIATSAASGSGLAGAQAAGRHLGVLFELLLLHPCLRQ